MLVPGLLLFLGGLVLTSTDFPNGVKVMLVGGVLVVIAGILKVVAAAHDLDNLRYELPASLLDTVAVDLDPHKPVNLFIDFRASQSYEFVQKVKQDWRGFVGVGPRLSYFSQVWLKLSATTVDGYRLRLSVTREGTLKSVPKSKHTKTRLRYVDCVQASVRPGKGRAMTVASDAPLAAPRMSRLTRFRGQISTRGAVARAAGPQYYEISDLGKTSVGEHLKGRDLAVMLMACFRGLQAASPEASRRVAAVKAR